MGDFNHDGKLDAAVLNFKANNVAVFLGKGDGTFQSPVSYGVSNQPISLAGADLNHDGNVDLVTANLSNNVSVLLGNADGTFRAATNYNVGVQALQLAVGDLNGDGVPDLAVAGLNGFVAVFVGKGDGTFSPPRTMRPDRRTRSQLVISTATGNLIWLLPPAAVVAGLPMLPY